MKELNVATRSAGFINHNFLVLNSTHIDTVDLVPSLLLNIPNLLHNKAALVPVQLAFHCTLNERERTRERDRENERERETEITRERERDRENERERETERTRERDRENERER